MTLLQIVIQFGYISFAVLPFVPVLCQREQDDFDEFVLELAELRVERFVVRLLRLDAFVFFCEIFQLNSVCLINLFMRRLCVTRANPVGTCQSWETTGPRTCRVR